MRRLFLMMSLVNLRPHSAARSAVEWLGERGQAGGSFFLHLLHHISSPLRGDDARGGTQICQMIKTNQSNVDWFACKLIKEKVASCTHILGARSARQKSLLAIICLRYAVGAIWSPRTARRVFINNAVGRTDALSWRGPHIANNQSCVCVVMQSILGNVGYNPLAVVERSMQRERNCLKI